MGLLRPPHLNNSKACARDVLPLLATQSDPHSPTPASRLAVLVSTPHNPPRIGELASVPTLQELKRQY